MTVDDGYISPQIPINLKYTLSIPEAASFYGIGEKKLRQIVSDNPGEDFFIYIGSRILIKKNKFENWLDGVSVI